MRPGEGLRGIENDRRQLRVGVRGLADDRFPYTLLYI